MASTTSPNMQLIVPTVGSEPGPTFAYDVNASLTLIDQHDHSLGKGVQITPAGLNINSTLTLNNNLLTSIAGLVLTSQTAANTTLDSISVAPGSGSSANDLFFTDGSGNTIQITKSGGLNVTAASIPGESYAAGTFIWTQTQSGLNTTPANFDIGSIIIRPNVAATTNGVRLSPPASISSLYTIDLPLLPSVTSFLTLSASGIMAANTTIDNTTIVNNSGVLSVGTGSITNTQLATGAALANIGTGGLTDSYIASQTITTDKIAPNTLQPSTMTFNTYTASQTLGSTVLTSSPQTIASITATLQTGRPVFTTFSGNFEVGSFSFGGTGGNVTFTLQYYNGSSYTTIQTSTVSTYFTANGSSYFPISILNFLDVTNISSPSFQYRLLVSAPTADDLAINAGTFNWTLTQL